MRNCFEISLINLRFNSRIGVFDQEREIGNDFLLNLNVHYDAESFGGDDDISSTVSYADIYEAVKEEMEIPCKLLETKALMIAKKISTRWLNIKSGEISIIKLAAPIPGIDGECGVKYFFENSCQ